MLRAVPAWIEVVWPSNVSQLINGLGIDRDASSDYSHDIGRNVERL